jgi:hypothetical protein
MTTEAEYTETFKKLIPEDSEALTPEQMTEVLMRHELAEFDNKLDDVMSTLVEEPVYELHPQAIRFSGRDAVRGFYERTLGFLNQFDHRGKEVDTREIVCVAFTGNQLVAELNEELELPNGTRKRVYLVTVVEYRGDKIVGERLYCDHVLAGLFDNALEEDFYSLPGVVRL